MTWWEAAPLARADIPVRRKVWPAGKTLVFTKGGGTTVAIAVIDQLTTTPTSHNTVRTVVKSTDFGKAEFEATDWEVA